MLHKTCFGVIQRAVSSQRCVCVLHLQAEWATFLMLCVVPLGIPYYQFTTVSSDPSFGRVPGASELLTSTQCCSREQSTPRRRETHSDDHHSQGIRPEIHTVPRLSDRLVQGGARKGKKKGEGGGEEDEKILWNRAHAFVNWSRACHGLNASGEYYLSCIDMSEDER